MKVNNHLVSIVTIVKNDFNSLERTILSIPISTSIESIIIDGSSDYSKQENFCRGYKEKTGLNIKYYKQKNKGLFGAMNEGLYKSNATWILFMCAGDIFDKGSYKFLDILEKLNEEKISSIIFRAKIISSKGKLLCLKPPINSISPKLFKFLSYLIPWLYGPCHQSMVFRTSDHKNILYEESGTIGSDENVMGEFMKKPFLLSDLVISNNDTCGVSSNPPKDLRNFFWYLKSAIKLRQPRRFFFILIKFFIASMGIKNFDKIRHFRHKIISPVILFLIRIFKK